ncbi:MAG: hypothetical protein SF052_03015 [Bacteroidia bacterium]|nr:hypothetical protein [Bacteroidia bacterium]
MKKNLIRFIVIFITLTGLVLFSPGCEEDPCETLTCDNGGVCLDGKCDCPEEFIGPTCSIKLDPCLQKPCSEAGTEACIAGNNGTAVCDCKLGYEGNLCETKWETKFTGNFISSEVCDGENVNYTLMITPGPNPRQITIANFNDQATDSTTAKVVGNLLNGTVFDIYKQYMSFGIVTGGGSIDDQRRITLTFQIIRASDTLVCSGIMFPN